MMIRYEREPERRIHFVESNLRYNSNGLVYVVYWTKDIRCLSKTHIYPIDTRFAAQSIVIDYNNTVHFQIYTINSLC